MNDRDTALLDQIALVGPQADELTKLLLGAALLVLTVLVTARIPAKGMFAVWLIVMGFIPVWLGVNVGVYLLPGSLIGLLVLVTLRRSRSGPICPADLTVAALILSTLVPVLLPGGASIAGSFAVLLQWALAYMIGRLLPGSIEIAWIYKAVAIVMSLIALLAIAEFLLSWNPFIELPGYQPLVNTWAEIQVRGGIPRAEGAWGHSIALGAAMSMSIPIVMGSQFSARIRLLMFALLTTAAIVSFSRIAMVGVGVAIVITLFFMPNSLSRGLKAGLAFVTAVAATIMYLFVSGVFEAGSQHAERSAQYRGNLFELIPTIAPLGRSDSYQRAADGSNSFGGFESIDNAVLLLGLRFGWIPLVLALVLMVGIVVVVIRRRATPATAALASQIPSLFGVALITQFTMYFWFIAGLAVATQVIQSKGDNENHAVATGEEEASAERRR